MDPADEQPLSPYFAPSTGRAKTDHEPRCWKCGRLLARLLTQPWHIDCPRCKAANRRGLGDAPAASGDRIPKLNDHHRSRT